MSSIGRNRASITCGPPEHPYSAASNPVPDDQFDERLIASLPQLLASCRAIAGSADRAQDLASKTTVSALTY